MLNCRNSKVTWFFLGMLLPIFLGCGDKDKATVTGKVTLENEPVASGYIWFHPEDKQGTSASGEIVDGEYRITGMTPGKKRVQITITEVSGSVADNPGRSRDEANAERLSKMKGRRAISSSAVPEQLVGNNQVKEVVAGNQSFDFNLEKPRAK